MNSYSSLLSLAREQVASAQSQSTVFTWQYISSDRGRIRFIAWGGLYKKDFDLVCTIHLALWSPPLTKSGFELGVFLLLDQLQYQG